MRLAAGIAKPSGSRRFDAMRVGTERYTASLPAYKHGQSDAQNRRHGRQRRNHVTHGPP